METPFILATAAQGADTSSVMNFNELVVALTWVAFLIAFVVLGKLLWKPILRYLESREEEIRTSLDDAAAARKAAEEADAKAAQTVADAERDARAKADAIAAATRKHIAEMETEAREALAAKRRAAEPRPAWRKSAPTPCGSSPKRRAARSPRPWSGCSPAC